MIEEMTAKTLAKWLLSPTPLDQAFQSGVFLSGDCASEEFLWSLRDELNRQNVIVIDVYLDHQTSSGDSARSAISTVLHLHGLTEPAPHGTIAECVMRLVDVSQRNVALIIVDVTQANDSLLRALKSARDITNLRQATSNRLLIVGTGQNTNAVRALVTGRNQAFLGASFMSEPSII